MGLHRLQLPCGSVKDVQKWTKLGAMFLENHAANTIKNGGWLNAKVPLSWLLCDDVGDLDRRAVTIYCFSNNDRTGSVPVCYANNKTAIYVYSFMIVDLLGKTVPFESVAEEKTYSNLLRHYYYTIYQTSQGCGARGQDVLNKAYDDIQQLAKNNPKLSATRIPHKLTVRDDGRLGTFGAMSAIAANGNCKQQ
jgi:hypothetical protein